MESTAAIQRAADDRTSTAMPPHWSSELDIRRNMWCPNPPKNACKEECQEAFKNYYSIRKRDGDANKTRQVIRRAASE